MQPERNQKDYMPWDDQVRSRGNKAGFAFQDRDCEDRYDLTHDWEWSSKGEAASLTYGGPNGAEKLKFDAPKGSLTIDGNVGIGTTPSAKLHVAGDLQVDKGATITGLLNANNGLTVNGGALTVNAGNPLNVQGGATISGAPLNALKGASITGDLTVTGKATVADLLTANKGLTVGGALTVNAGNPLNAQGGATISGAPFKALNGASITGDLTVTGKSTITDLLTANKGLTVSGGALTVNAGNPLNAQGGATISGAPLNALNGASITGDLTVTGKATVADLLTANNGLTVNGGALTVDGGLTVNTGGARIGGELANVKSPAYSTPLAIQASGTPQGLMCFEAKKDEKWIRKWDLCLGTIGPKSGLEFIETDVDHGRLFLQEGGNVGIGTTSPEAKLHVAGNLKVQNADCDGKLIVGEANVKGRLWINGNYHLSYFTKDGLNAVKLGYYESNAYLYYIDGQGAWNALSSQQLKTNIAPITDVLNKMDRIRGVYFNWNEDHISTNSGAQKQRHIGMIAEEIEPVFPELVSRVPDEDREILGLNYSNFTAILVQAVKELKALNQSLSERVKALEASRTY